MAATATQLPQSPVTSAAMRPDTLSHIDLSTLSQSELQTLSLFTSTKSQTLTLIPPQIDPSIFNESTGSRRQTYSAAASHHRRRGAAVLHPDNPPPPPRPPSRSDHIHNRLIIDRLKSLISRHPSFHSVDLLSPPPPPPPVERKRRRGRKPKSFSASAAARVEFSAEAAAALAEMEDPFGEELRRRTVGLESEEELLGFMRGVEGQWGSRRKRRRIVDAAEFGEALPLGWKLLLGIRRKEGRSWIYCRRYISPTEQHFISCKDVSLYLQSISAQNMSRQHPDYGHGVEDMPVDRDATRTHAGLIFKDGDQSQDVSLSSIVPTSVCNGNGNGNEWLLLGIENLAEVQIQDLFECHKCNITFDEKDSYLQHLLSVHQRITRRFRIGSSVGAGVIIKDGKFECQFCHKVFEERRRYNGHVGIHVRNFVRGVEEVPGPNADQDIESITGDGSSLRISKMDALIEIAQNSILEASAEPSNASEHDTDLTISGRDRDVTMIDQGTSYQLGDKDMDIDRSIEKNDGGSKAFNRDGLESSSDDLNTEQKRDSHANPSLTSAHIDTGDGTKVKGNCKSTDVADDKNDELKMDIDDSTYDPSDGIEPESAQSFPSFHSINEASDTVERIFGVEPSHENEPGFDKLRIEEIKSLKYRNLQDVPIVLANSSEMVSVFSRSSVRFESEELILNMARRDPTTTVCVWCGIESNDDVAVDSELEQESVGFVCQRCKSEVTAKPVVIDSGSSVNPLGMI